MKWKTPVTWAAIVVMASPLIIFIVPQVLGFNAYIIDSSSMEPTLNKGDIVYTERINPENLRKDDVIVFQPNQSRINEARVIHRITEINSTPYGYEFVTKGDANVERDPGTTRDYRVIGKTIMSVPIIGYYIWFIERTPLLLFLLIIPSAILIREEMLKLVEN